VKRLAVFSLSFSFGLALTACSDQRAPSYEPTVQIAPLSLLENAQDAETGEGTEAVEAEGADAEQVSDDTQKPAEASLKEPPADARYRAIKARAESGDLNAQVDLAMLHLTGMGGAPKDRVLAVMMLEHAVEKGSPRAMNNLATVKITEDRQRARELFEQAAALGDQDARRHAAFLKAYPSDGSSLTDDENALNEAKQALSECADQGDLFAASLLGSIELEQGHPVEAVRWLRAPALDGVSQAVSDLLDVAERHPEAVDAALLKKVEHIDRVLRGEPTPKTDSASKQGGA